MQELLAVSQNVLLAANRRKAFTLIELLVVIAIISILAAILFPVFAQAKAAAKRTGTISNLKQNVLAVNMYAIDHDDVVPLVWQDWPNNIFIIQKLYPYTKSLDMAWDPMGGIPSFAGGRPMEPTNPAGSWGNWTISGTLGWSNGGMTVPINNFAPRVMSSQEHISELMILSSCRTSSPLGCFSFTETQASCYNPDGNGRWEDPQSPGYAAYSWHNKNLPAGVMDGHAVVAKGMIYAAPNNDCDAQTYEWWANKSSVGDYTPNNAWSEHYLTDRVLNFWGTWWDATR